MDASERSPATAGRNRLTEGVPQPESVLFAWKPLLESVRTKYPPVDHRWSVKVEPDINSQQTECSRVRSIKGKGI